MRNTVCIGLMALTATAAMAQSKPRRPAPKAPPAAAVSVPAPAALSIPAVPQPAQNAPACEALARTVELNLKTLGVDYANSGMTKAAAQATQVANETANDLAILKINLDLLVANRCPAWGRPVGLMNYGGSALSCAKALPADKAAKCDQDSWKAAF
jgi:hypothetical protein